MPNPHDGEINDIQRRRHDAVSVQPCADGVHEVGSVLGRKEDTREIRISRAHREQILGADFRNYVDENWNAGF
jgi:hypothetical protein